MHMPGREGEREGAGTLETEVAVDSEGEGAGSLRAGPGRAGPMEMKKRPRNRVLDMVPAQTGRLHTSISNHDLWQKQQHQQRKIANRKKTKEKRSGSSVMLPLPRFLRLPPAHPPCA